MPKSKYVYFISLTLAEGSDATAPAAKKTRPTAATFSNVPTPPLLLLSSPHEARLDAAAGWFLAIFRRSLPDLQQITQPSNSLSLPAVPPRPCCLLFWKGNLFPPGRVFWGGKCQETRYPSIVDCRHGAILASSALPTNELAYGVNTQRGATVVANHCCRVLLSKNFGAKRRPSQSSKRNFPGERAAASAARPRMAAMMGKAMPMARAPHDQMRFGFSSFAQVTTPFASLPPRRNRWTSYLQWTRATAFATDLCCFWCAFRCRSGLTDGTILCISTTVPAFVRRLVFVFLKSKFPGGPNFGIFCDQKIKGGIFHHQHPIA